MARSPFAARAKSDGVRRVGVIMGFAETDEVWQAYLSTFRQALQNLGWTALSRASNYSSTGVEVRFDQRKRTSLAFLSRFGGEARTLIERCEYISLNVLQNLVRKRWRSLRDRP
jgi:hypothetical protein